MVNKFLIKRKIDEYLVLLKYNGYIKDNNYYEISKKFRSLKIKRIYNAPGDAKIDGTTLMICNENIEHNMQLKGEYYLDEVLFHEFSHFINSFHNSIYGYEKVIIRDYIQKNMDNFTTIEVLEEGDKNLYNQDPYLGILLLDEFIAQSIAQKLILYKLGNLDSSSKEKYVFDICLREYKPRYITTNICEPPITIQTSLATYPEFYIFSVKFLNKYGFNVDDFIKESINPNFVKKFINKVDKEKMSELYIDLCYLGIIRERVYLLKGFKNINDRNDPAYSPQKVHTVMSKILRNNN